MDIILGNFALHNINLLTTEELSLYEDIVNTDDLKLYSYITQNIPVPENLNSNLINSIIDFNVLCNYNIFLK